MFVFKEKWGKRKVISGYSFIPVYFIYWHTVDALCFQVSEGNLIIMFWGVFFVKDKGKSLSILLQIVNYTRRIKNPMSSHNKYALSVTFVA